MPPALMGFVRMPGVDDHDNCGDGVRNGEQDAVFNRIEAAVLKSRGKEGHATVGGAIMEKVNREHDEHCGMAQTDPPRDRLGRIQMLDLSAESGFQVKSFLLWQPFCLLRMVGNA